MNRTNMAFPSAGQGMMPFTNMDAGSAPRYPSYVGMHSQNQFTSSYQSMPPYSSYPSMSPQTTYPIPQGYGSYTPSQSTNNSSWPGGMSSTRPNPSPASYQSLNELNRGFKNTKLMSVKASPNSDHFHWNKPSLERSLYKHSEKDKSPSYRRHDKSSSPESLKSHKRKSRHHSRSPVMSYQSKESRNRHSESSDDWYDIEKRPRIGHENEIRHNVPSVHDDRRLKLFINPDRIPSPPPPPILSDSDKKLSRLSESSAKSSYKLPTKVADKESVSLSCLLEAVMEKSGQKKNEFCNAKLKNEILTDCENKIRLLYKRRIAGIGAFVPDPMEERLVNNHSSPVITFHPHLNYNAGLDKNPWTCPGVKIPPIKKVAPVIYSSNKPAPITTIETENRCDSPDSDVGVDEGSRDTRYDTESTSWSGFGTNISLTYPDQIGNPDQNRNCDQIRSRDQISNHGSWSECAPGNSWQNEFVEPAYLQPSPMASMVPNIGPLLNAMPNIMQNVVPNVMPNLISNAIPNVMPNSMPNIAPNSIPRAMPNSISSIIPNTMQSHLPNTMPVIIPNVAAYQSHPTELQNITYPLHVKPNYVTQEILAFKERAASPRWSREKSRDRHSRERSSRPSRKSKKKKKRRSSRSPRRHEKRSSPRKHESSKYDLISKYHSRRHESPDISVLKDDVHREHILYRHESPISKVDMNSKYPSCRHDSTRIHDQNPRYPLYRHESPLHKMDIAPKYPSYRHESPISNVDVQPKYPSYDHDPYRHESLLSKDDLKSKNLSYGDELYRCESPKLKDDVKPKYPSYGHEPHRRESKIDLKTKYSSHRYEAPVGKVDTKPNHHSKLTESKVEKHIPDNPYPGVPGTLFGEEPKVEEKHKAETKPKVDVKPRTEEKSNGQAKPEIEVKHKIETEFQDKINTTKGADSELNFVESRFNKNLLTLAVQKDFGKTIVESKKPDKDTDLNENVSAMVSLLKIFDQVFNVGPDIRKIQEKSLVYSLIIQSLEKGEKSYTKLYVLKNKALCKIIKENDLNLVMPRDNLKEFIVLLHNSFHDISQEDMLKFLRHFLYPQNMNIYMNVIKVFRECSFCKSLPQHSKVEPLIDKTSVKKQSKSTSPHSGSTSSHHPDHRKQTNKSEKKINLKESQSSRSEKRDGSSLKQKHYSDKSKKSINDKARNPVHDGRPSGYEKSTKSRIHLPKQENCQRNQNSGKQGNLSEEEVNNKPLDSEVKVMIKQPSLKVSEIKVNNIKNSHPECIKPDKKYFNTSSDQNSSTSGNVVNEQTQNEVATKEQNVVPLNEQNEANKTKQIEVPKKEQNINEVTKKEQNGNEVTKKEQDKNESNLDFKSLIRNVQMTEYGDIIHSLESGDTKSLRECYVLKAGMLCKKSVTASGTEVKIIAPPSEIEKVIGIVHTMSTVHTSAQKVISFFSKHFTSIENLENKVHDYLKMCPVCQK